MDNKIQLKKEYIASENPKCIICGKEYNKKSGSFTSHLKREHKMRLENYYVEHLMTRGKDIDDHCVVCGQKTRFDMRKIEYSSHCSVVCKNKNIQMNEQKKHTVLKKYGVTNILVTKENIERLNNSREVKRIKKVNDWEHLKRIQEKQIVEEEVYMPPIYSDDGMVVGIEENSDEDDGFTPL